MSPAEIPVRRVRLVIDVMTCSALHVLKQAPHVALAVAEYGMRYLSTAPESIEAYECERSASRASTADDAYWLVWTPGTIPTVQHGTAASASAEAERLSRAAPGKRFYVLRAEGYALTPTGTQFTSLREPPPF